MTSLFLLPTDQARAIHTTLNANVSTFGNAAALEVNAIPGNVVRCRKTPLYKRSLVLVTVVLIQSAVALALHQWTSGSEKAEVIQPIMVKMVDEQKVVDLPRPAEPLMVEVTMPKITLPDVQHITLAPAAPVAQVTPPAEATPPVPTAAEPTPLTDDAEKSYYSEIFRRMAKFKSYPRAAKMNKIEGVVEVTFSFNQQGVLLSSAVTQSSGQPLLDQAALDTLRKASPFPPIPKEMGKTQLTLTVPIAFNMK